MEDVSSFIPVLSHNDQVPSTGWDVVLLGDNLLVELIPQIPLSSVIASVDGTPSANTFKECHGLIVGISDRSNDRWKDIFHTGDRVIIHGTLVPVNVNGCSYFIVPMLSVQCIIKRADGGEDPAWISRQKK